MTRPVLFLDMDGVLTSTFYGLHRRTNNAIDPRCVDCLSRVVEHSNCQIVLSSSWRYMLRNGGEHMTLRGFEYLLRSHGLQRASGLLIGVTPLDEEVASPRSNQVRAWLEANGQRQYAVVDDDNDGFTAAGMPFVQTDTRYGLAPWDADKLVVLLTMKVPVFAPSTPEAP